MSFDLKTHFLLPACTLLNCMVTLKFCYGSEANKQTIYLLNRINFNVLLLFVEISVKNVILIIRWLVSMYQQKANLAPVFFAKHLVLTHNFLSFPQIRAILNYFYATYIYANSKHSILFILFF